MNHTINLIDVSLYLRGENLDPDVVSRTTGISPSSSQRKGEVKRASTELEYVTQMGVWELTSESNSLNLCEHISELMGKVRKSPETFLSIEGVEEAFIDIFISTHDSGEGATYELELSSDNILALSQLNIPVHLTFAVVKE